MKKYCEHIMKNRNQTSAIVRKSPYTLQLIKEICRVYNSGEESLIKPSNFWKEVTEGFVAARIMKKEDYDLIIDVGTGVGLSAYYIAKKFPNSKVIGIDPLETSIRRTMWTIIKKLSPNVEFVTKPIEEFEVPDANKIAIVGVHNCRELSIIDIEFAAKHNAELYLIPCCWNYKELKKRGIDMNVFNVLNESNETKYYKWIIGLATYAKTLGLNVETGTSETLKKVTKRYGFIRTK